MESSDTLFEVPMSDWKELRDMFLLNWPENQVAWYTVNNYLNWFRMEPDIKHLKIYSLNGTWRSDGTYVIVDRYQLFIYTLELSNDKLKRALTLVDWSCGLEVSSFLKRHRSAVIDVVQEKKLTVEYESLKNLYFLSKGEVKAKTMLAPSNVTLKPLSVDNAELVDASWSHKRAGSISIIKRLIEMNPNIGAFDGNNELMGWSIRSQNGSICLLKVREKFERKGIGSLVTLAMCKILANNEMDTFAFVEHQNIASKKMFMRLGFKHIDDAYWLRTYPFDGTFEWNDVVEVTKQLI